MSIFDDLMDQAGELAEKIGADMGAAYDRLKKIEARLSALEAAQKKLELQPVSIRDVLSHEPKGCFESRPDGSIGWRKFNSAEQKKPDAPTPEQREPGWYWVKWEEGDWSVAKLRLSPPGSAVRGFEEQWWKGAHWTALSPVLIGPRIQEPRE